MPGTGHISWKRIPFLKLFGSLATGITWQWYFPAGVVTLWSILGVALLLQLFIFGLPFFERYRFSFLPGMASIILFVAAGGLLSHHENTRNDPRWFGHFYTANDGLEVVLEEPLVEKTKTYKAIARARFLFQGEKAIPVHGRIILYIKKQDPGDDSLIHPGRLGYGTRLVFKKPLQEIRNAGNPGGFNYKRYCLFQGITHQVYLENDTYIRLPGKKITRFRQFIYSSREKIIRILRKFIRGEKERGLAEALLIGYKDDLDPSLVQSYTNTGVVHIIAISGLHLGLIYWLLTRLFNPWKRQKHLKRLVPILVISGLWIFSFLAGAQPSILRSALMFTGIVIGEHLTRKSPVYNTLALSAFVLLCINPFWLWDIGFQLSYAAVLSILLFLRPIYNLCYFKNKWLDHAWKLNAITLSAQVLTVPVSIYHFHQFPNYFILTNLVAVPLSSGVLFGEILLCLLSWFNWLAGWMGKILEQLIRFMNYYIRQIEGLPGSLWDGLQINLTQALFLLFFACGCGYWLIERSKRGLQTALFALLGFALLRTYSLTESREQERIIIYNIPRKTAIDISLGQQFIFIGDSSIQSDELAASFHLRPARTLFRTREAAMLKGVVRTKNYVLYGNKHILLLDHPLQFGFREQKPVIHLLILSKNPQLDLSKLAATLDIRQVVIDGSVPSWKSVYWKKDCDSLGIPCHDVSFDGAFVMTLR